MFAVKNSMINIPANFSSKCECAVREDMYHVYNCRLNFVSDIVNCRDTLLGKLHLLETETGFKANMQSTYRYAEDLLCYVQAQQCGFCLCCLGLFYLARLKVKYV